MLPLVLPQPYCGATSASTPADVGRHQRCCLPTWPPHGFVHRFLLPSSAALLLLMLNAYGLARKANPSRWLELDGMASAIAPLVGPW
jgi:hypothetical protein